MTASFNKVETVQIRLTTRCCLFWQSISLPGNILRAAILPSSEAILSLCCSTCQSLVGTGQTFRESSDAGHVKVEEPFFFSFGQLVAPLIEVRALRPILSLTIKPRANLRHDMTGFRSILLLFEPFEENVKFA